MNWAEAPPQIPRLRPGADFERRKHFEKAQLYMDAHDM
jgi:hypothetical protein